jgi:Asp-tRNA(Asn)/Glu-tRNA(Gln) amidotransferase A subunit family amidase
VHRFAIVGATAGCIVMAVSVTAIAQGTDTAANPIPDRPSVPPLPQLSDAQRGQIRAALNQEHTDVSFAETKSAASFEPAVGAKLPKGVQAQPLPQPLISQVPTLREYTYVKFRDQILIVNPLTEEIVDMFAQR